MSALAVLQGLLNAWSSPLFLFLVEFAPGFLVLLLEVPAVADLGVVGWDVLLALNLAQKDAPKLDFAPFPFLVSADSELCFQPGMLFVTLRVIFVTMELRPDES